MNKKSTIKRVFTVSLVSLLDTALVPLYFVMGRPSFFPLLLLHGIFFILLIILRGKSEEKELEVSPLILLIIPGFGSLFFGISYIVLAYGSFKYGGKFVHSLKKDTEEFEELKYSDINTLKRIMSLSGILDYASVEEKKRTIINMVSENLNVHLGILKKGLHDADPEVVHYTASTLNYLETRYEKEIIQTKRLYNKEKTKQLAEKLVKLYENYMNSGLIDQDILPVYRRKLIADIEFMRKNISGVFYINSRLVNAYIEEGLLDQAETVLNEMQSSFPQEGMLQVMWMKYYFYRRNLHRVTEIAEQIDELDYQLPYEYSRMVSFWSGRLEKLTGSMA
ncbi:MAG: hypothetical protein K9L75_00520 [Spirochaetia bacterium]|nr:hypothetical protein [Spirochaetia bacterium]